MTILLVKVTLLLALGLGAAALARPLAAAQRHLLLLATLVGALLLPAVALVAPPWDAPILPATVSIVPPSAPGVAARAFTPMQAAPAPRAEIAGRAAPTAIAAPESHVGRDALLVAVWILGTLAMVAWLIAGRLRLGAITARAWPALPDEWTSMLLAERVRAGIARDVELRVSPAITTPLTWGVRAPVILLPEDALDWPEAHRRVVLRHELAHVARGDGLWQLVAGATCALYWFHPLAWLAGRQLRLECERACDDRVLSSGTAPLDYASHLVAVVRASRAVGGWGFLSLAMARPSQLERRVRALLDEQQSRAPLTARARVAVGVCGAMAVLAVSAFRPVPSHMTTTFILEGTPVAALAPDAVAAPAPLQRTAASATARPPYDSTFVQSIAARDGERLVLDLRPTGGDVTITGWDEPRIEVHGRLGGRNAAETVVTLERSGSGVLLQARYTGTSHESSFSHDFDIRVPRHTDVRINSAGGDVRIAGVEGEFTGSTGGGEINVSHAKGRLRLSTGGGNVQVELSDLRGWVSTGGGVVHIRQVTGELSGSSGTGEVYYDDEDTRGRRGAKDSDTTDHTVTSIVSGGDPAAAKFFGTSGIRRNRSGGDIQLAAAPDGAHVTTGGGAIRVGPSAGEVYASTGGGPIEIGPARGSVIASSGAGNLAVTFAGAGAHSGDLVTGLGEVVVTIPADASATLELESAYTNNYGHPTRIVSDFPVETTETGDWDSSNGTPRRYVRARLVLGRGEGVIHVRTLNGNVVLRRAR